MIDDHELSLLAHIRQPVDGQFFQETGDVFLTSRHRRLVTVLFLGAVHKLSYLLTYLVSHLISSHMS